MNLLLALPLVATFTAGSAALIGHRHRGVQRALSAVGALTLLGVGIALLAVTADGTVVASRVGDFPAPFAITLAADGLAALLLTVTGLVASACLGFAAASRTDTHPSFHPLAQILLAGISLSFLTADLFNLFVAFEVMLIASYVLVVVDGSENSRRAAFTYVAVNLTGSTLLLLGIGLTYGLTGTVNLAELARVAPDTPGLLVPAALLFTAFTVKAGLVPVHGWMPRAYPAASPAVAALFSGLLTKVGVYALYRVSTLLFPGDRRVLTALAVIAGLSMLVGVLGALGQGSLRRILSFHITSQIGYMIFGLALATTAGLAAGIAYTIHHIVVKTTLFLSAGAVEISGGTGRLDQLGGIARRRPVLTTAFALAASSLAGLPPLSGFVPKLALLQVAFRQQAWTLAGVSLLVSLLTLLSMLKIWNSAFWGSEPGTHTPDDAAVGAGGTGAGAREVAVPAGGAGGRAGTRTFAVLDRRRRAAQVAPALGLAAVSVALGLGAGGLLALATGAAEQLTDPSAYVDAVLGPAPTGGP